MTDPNDSILPAPSILLVDDDERLRSRMARAFEERGYEVRQAEGYDEALATASAESTEYAVVDLRMPGKSGLEVVRALHGIDASTKIVVLTGYGSIATALEAVRLGATHYLTKPADVDEVISAFARAHSAEGRSTIPKGEEPQTPSLARVEAHPPGPDRLRRQHHQGCGKTGNSPALPPAQAGEVSLVPLTRCDDLPHSKVRPENLSSRGEGLLGARGAAGAGRDRGGCVCVWNLLGGRSDAYRRRA